MFTWRKRKTRYKQLQFFSVRDKLRKEGRSSIAFEIMINALTIEEMLALKLELASREFDDRLYGMPLWGSLTDIVKDAIIKYAYSAGNNVTEIIKFLGLTKTQYTKLIWKHQPLNYFTGKRFIFKNNSQSI